MCADYNIDPHTVTVDTDVSKIEAMKVPPRPAHPELDLKEVTDILLSEQYTKVEPFFGNSFTTFRKLNIMDDLSFGERDAGWHIKIRKLGEKWSKS